MKMLKIIAVGDVQTASNGNSYKVLRLQALDTYLEVPGMKQPIEVVSNARPASRTVWQGQDGLFDAAQVNKATAGQIKRFDVAEYTFQTSDGQERTATSFTGVQWEGEDDATTIRRYGHTAPEATVVESAETEANKATVEKPIPA